MEKLVNSPKDLISYKKAIPAPVVTQAARTLVNVEEISKLEKIN